MLNDDMMVLIATALGTIATAVAFWRMGVRGRRLAVSVWAGFYGVAMIVMLAAHCIEIAYNTLTHAPAFGGGTFKYDWRVYSLELMGVLLIVLGVRALRAAVGMARGHAEARAAMLKTLAVVLAIALPIIPIHWFFGYLVSGLTAITVMVVAALPRTLPERTAGMPSAAPAAVQPVHTANG
ncbi:MAG TPA: hypothetical protein VFH27_08455 [Longimicrobiaceae bacterium]|nr:hypothetical protein [Longimicrobiaceae bacterium]